MSSGSFPGKKIQNPSCILAEKSFSLRFFQSWSRDQNKQKNQISHIFPILKTIVKNVFIVIFQASRPRAVGFQIHGLQELQS